MRGTQVYPLEPNIPDLEKILCFMARESRVRRRMLARALEECINETPADQRRLRIVNPQSEGDPYYVFLLVPRLAVMGEEEYRNFRLHFLRAACMVLRLVESRAIDIIGIATESGNKKFCSEDAMYCDFRDWPDEFASEARQLQEVFELMKNVRHKKMSEYEYPLQFEREIGRRIGRNERCPCGSGKKWKKCHGA